MYRVHTGVHIEQGLTPASTSAAQCLAVHTRLEMHFLMDHWHMLSEAHPCGRMTADWRPEVHPPISTAVPF